MRIRALVIAGSLGLVGLVTSRASSSDHRDPPVRAAPPRASAPPATRPTRVEPAPALPGVALDPEVAPVPGDDGPTGIAGTGIEVSSLDAAMANRGIASLRGTVIDASSGEPLSAVTVIVTSPALEGEQVAITDEVGRYRLPGLPPGEYHVTFYYAEATVEHPHVPVSARAITELDEDIDPDHDGPPVVDESSTTQGITIDPDYIRNIPVPSRTFEAALGAAAGSQGDPIGVTFSGEAALDDDDDLHR